VIGALALVLAGLVSAAVLARNTGQAADRSPVKVGILHSFTGTMAGSEVNVVRAERLAISEVNSAGGVNGHPIQPVVVDGRSDPQTFADGAQRLITRDKVSVIFGCWTSASRRQTVPVIARHRSLLVYPVQFEGLENSPYVLYTGAAPNQQILPAVKWFLDNRGKDMYLVGSDYVFPRSANAIIRDELKFLGGRVDGEKYIKLGSSDVAGVVRDIVRRHPSVIVNTINGDSNVAFFQALRRAGITPQKIPTVSFSIGEAEMQHMGVRNMAGDYASWNYFESFKSARNAAFVRAVQQRYGRGQVTTDPMEAAYDGVHLWAMAAEKAGSVQPDAVRRALPNLEFDSPEGPVYVDGQRNFLWKTPRLGQIGADGQFRIAWTDETFVHPVPYPPYRTEGAWNTLLTDLRRRWHGAWAAS
jgi:urea transport system substrate-binding protein